MTGQTVGVALIELLRRYAVEHVFGIPGVHTIELYRGLAAGEITHHTPRHEQGAGFMADGYARVSGKPGVCFVITGPGLTNIATPMGQALADSIPMLVISSVNDTLNTPQARGMLHEMPDQLALSRTLTRFSQTIHSADELAPALANAFGVFAGSRPGPVHLQLPVSLLGAPYTPRRPARVVLPGSSGVDAAALNAAAAAISQSKSPVILAGGGCRHASTAIRQLAECIDAPVFLTINARGVLSPDCALAVPVSGTMNAAREAIAASDLVLALGTELSATDYDQYKDDGFTINGTLVRCDIDPLQLNNNAQPDISIVADTRQFASAMLQQLTPCSRQGAARCKAIKNAAEQELTAEMRTHLSLLERLRSNHPDAIFVGDSTQLIYSGNLLFNCALPNHWFNSSVGFGTLGYALPAAIGASLAKPGNPVICIIGDGGLQFVLGELGALKDALCPVAVLVWRNNGYREIKTSMERAGVTSVGVEFAIPDYCQVAAAYGLSAVSVASEEALCAELQSTFAKQKPLLVELEESLFMQ
jgi:acetolactate synthase-1/2/3 large subunit